ncbi:ABC-type transporter, substrate-binding protein [Desulforapulum autotrophicum HRM2]|uniref:ABC-type transporter, substrate-binding protein n=1 Tax=Desulforapulum autotrophicum (strain ATCC 43914 / DSM 3382 / VKM B-1955 / HRM2) TaxID=177437 RepID=C0QGS3_DESAH|nr:ABC transporter substrate-binding protein [Desulforapulum autotrophicum]ACN13548.1 ABC-type transporter, substrate-binding protein [Desulforapulum autotrophicum HRM2]
MKKRIILVISTLILLAAVPVMGAEQLKLMLDWFPNVDHLPIYLAQESGYFKDQGLTVEIITPSETSDGLKLAAAGQVDLAVSYQPQTIIAADQGLDLKAVAPLVIHPLTTLLFLDKTIKTPADLSGKNIGYTVPGLMDVLLHAFANLNGVKNYTPINVGFTILPALVSGKVDAVMGPFKTYETVVMKQQGYTARFFELENNGIPDYEELIFVAGSKTLAKKEAAIHKFTKAIQLAMAQLETDPTTALKLYLKAVPEADANVETAAFELTRPYFAGQNSHDPAKWQAFADFALTYGLIKNHVDTAGLIHTWHE